MSKERWRPIQTFTPFAASLALYYLSTWAFSRKTRYQILERDNFACTETGATNRLEAAHWDHSRQNPDYDDPDNGRTLTIREHYLDHFYRRDNGLEDDQNEWAVNKIWERLTKQERDGLPKPETYHQLHFFEVIDERSTIIYSATGD